MAEFKSCKLSSEKYHRVYSFRLHDQNMLTWHTVDDLTGKRLNPFINKKKKQLSGEEGRKKEIQKKKKKKERCRAFIYHTSKIISIHWVVGIELFNYSGGNNRHKTSDFPRQWNFGNNLFLFKLGLKHASLYHWITESAGRTRVFHIFIVV